MLPPPLQANWKNAKWLTGALSASVGALVIVGWALGVPVLKSVNPAWVAMKANTAIGFALLGLSMMSGASKSSFYCRAARFCALAVGLIGALTLGEYITGISLGIDQLLFLEPKGAAGTVELGRMAPDTAVCFVLLGAALSLPSCLRNIRGGSLPVIFGFLAAAIGLVSLTAYAILPPLAHFGWWGQTPMAFQTAALFAAAGTVITADAIKEESSAWALGRLVTSAFMISTVLAIGTGYYSHRSVMKLISTDREIAANEENLRLATRALSAVIRAESVARGYLLSGNEKELKELSAARAAALDKIDVFLEAASGAASPDFDGGLFVEKAAELLHWQPHVVSARRAGSRASLPHTLARGEALRNEMSLAFERLERTWQKTSLEKRRVSSDLASFANKIILMGLLLELSILMIALLGLNQSEVKRHQAQNILRESEEQLKLSAKELAKSEARYRTLFEMSKDALITLEPPSWRFTSANTAAVKMLRAGDKAQLIGLEPSALSAVKQAGGQLSKEMIQEIIEKTMTQGQQSLEWNCRRLDGEVFFASILASRVETPEGPFIQATIRDITERKLAENALRESENRYRRIVETTREGYCEIDAAGRIVSINPRMSQMFGYAPGEMIGLILIEDLYFPEDRIELLKRLQRRAKGESETFEQRFKTKTGEPLWMIVSATPIMSEEGVYRGSFAMMADITNRKLSEAELKQLQTAVEQTGESLFITDSKGTIQYVNPAFEASTGYSRREILGKNPRILKSGKQDAEFYHQLWETISSGRVWKGRLINKRKDGSLLTEDATISPVRDADGRIGNYVAIKRDVTDHVRLENELRQSQKMESVGRLAGGVAHDFNNILTAINGYTGFALAGLAEGDPRREDLKEVLIASGRATRLTRQLLAFSRKQILDPQILDINTSINETVNMLKRVIGEDVALKTKLAAYPCLAKVDAGQIEQVFLNLAVNARDAMPKGGTLIFETEIVPVTTTFLSRHPETPLGSLVCLSAHDTGCGMPEEVKTRIFEPFFTTKEKGKGTGLGLSTVYGIVKQSGGDIEVESAPGRGTTFRIYFPQINPRSQAQEHDKDKGTGAVPGGSETVLFVEDEGTLRRLGARSLIARGYTVLLAADGQEALKVLSQHGEAVDLLITDVVMPGMNGRELALSIASTKMARRTLYISGFTDDAIVKHGVLEPGLAFLYKPFTPEDLLRKMREVLDGPADKARA